MYFCLVAEYFQVVKNILDMTKKQCGMQEGLGIYKNPGKGGEQKIVNHIPERVSSHLKYSRMVHQSGWGLHTR